MVEIVRVKPGESGYEASMEAKVKKKVKGGGGSLNEAALAKKREYAREYYRRKVAAGVKKPTGRTGGSPLAAAIEELRKERDELDRTIATLERLSAK